MKNFRIAAGLLAALFAAGAAPAQNASSPESGTKEAAERPFAKATKADDDLLNASTAREDLSLHAQSSQSSSVSSSSVNGTSTTGEIRIADQALQNASGLTVINNNTGNNVAMNASLNVNLVINPNQQ